MTHHFTVTGFHSPRSASCLMGFALFLSMAMSAAAGVISGTVTDATGTNKLPDILVEVYRVEASSWPFVNSGTTDTNGHYAISFTGAGNYVVRFSDPAQQYIAQFYHHADSFFTATNIPMTITGTNASINAAMDEVSRITGTAYASDNTTPLSGIFVTAYKYNTEFLDWEEAATTTTGIDGGYELTGLYPDSYRIRFQDFSGALLTEWYLNAATIDDATDVVVPLSATVPGINVAMSIASRITGTVLDSSTDAPLEGITVSALKWGGSSWITAGSSATDQDGNYEIGGLAAGDYRVQFVDGNGTYVTLFYFDALDIDGGTDVGVAEADTVTGIDAAMFPFSTISGNVSTTNGLPLANVEVSALRWNGFDWEVISVGYTSGGGDYQVGSLAPGTYRMRYDGNLDYGFPLWYYTQTLYVTNATDIGVAAGVSVTGINIQIYLPAPNAAPTNVILTSAVVSENVETGTVVGVFTTEDPDVGDTFTYEFASGAGDDDNGMFVIDGDALRTATVLNYEAASNRSIRVKSMDQAGGAVEVPLVITVTDIDEIPVLLGVVADSSGGLVIQWTSLSNQVFAVHRSTNSMASFDLVLDAIAATPPVNSYTSASSAAGASIRVTAED